MSANAWAEGSTLPLTSAIDGNRVYVNARALSLTPAQARAAGQRLIEQADQLEQPDPHAPAVARMNEWLARGAGLECLICKASLTGHGICNGCAETGRRLDEQCQDCDMDVIAPCICEIALSHEQVLRGVEEKR